MSQANYPLTLSYSSESSLHSDDKGSVLRLALESSRGELGFRGKAKNPELWRDALLTATDLLGSDLRHKAKDRSAYLAYLAKQGKKATNAIWEAQKAYLLHAVEDDTRAETALDPICTIHPDEVSFELFSRDESAYARLSVSNTFFSEREAAHGTSFVTFSENFVSQLDRLRSYQGLSIDMGTAHAGEKKSQDISVSSSWLRGFLQVQSAATLPASVCELAPIDFYNLLFALRTMKAKQSPRALRFELVPGQSPRMILEPWELVLECHGPVYSGKSPRVVRSFGRQRLLALSRLLPHLRSVRVHLLGAGLPLFWVFDAGEVTLTVALTGWSESSWAGATSFDAIMPSEAASEFGHEVFATLQQHGPMSPAELSAACKLQPETLRDALKVECLRGRVLFDIAKGQYRPRALFATAVDEKALRYGSAREAQAHRLLAEKGVTLTKLHDVVGEGTVLSGDVADKVARRSYVTSFSLDLEGRVYDASCTCPTFRRSGLREGPCEHMLALRIQYLRQRAALEAMRQTPEGRKLVQAETRTLSRRESDGREEVYRVSFDAKSVRLRWGYRNQEARQQRLWFDSDAEARDAYFATLEKLTSSGFLDADAG